MNGGGADPQVAKQYFLSPTFRYDLLIVRDCGPQYAEDMGWRPQTLDALMHSDATVAIIDNRITAADLPLVAVAIKASPQRLFVFTIVDPFHKQNEDGPYRRLLLDMAAEPNVVYPERTELHSALRRQPLLRLVIRHLKHPGYPDVGDPVVHRHIGGDFARLLADYRFMVVSGSRCDLEFLKYRECAYAGCVPVGLAPASFPTELRESVLLIEPARPWQSLKRQLRLPGTEIARRAKVFADLQHSYRNPGLLNRELDRFLHRRLLRIGQAAA